MAKDGNPTSGDPAINDNVIDWSPPVEIPTKAQLEAQMAAASRLAPERVTPEKFAKTWQTIFLGAERIRREIEEKHFSLRQADKMTVVWKALGLKWHTTPNICCYAADLYLDCTDLAIIEVAFAHQRSLGRWSFPSNATVAKMLGIDVATVKRHKRALVGMGYLRIVRRKNRKGDTSSLWDFTNLLCVLYFVALERSLEDRIVNVEDDKTSGQDSAPTKEE